MKNITKRLLASILAAGTLFTVLPAFAEETAEVTTEVIEEVVDTAAIEKAKNDELKAKYAEEIALLNGLGIISDTNIKMESSITRAEFLSLVMKMIQMDTLNKEYTETVFYDVLPDSEYYGIVMNANQLGLVNGDSNNCFNPNKTIDSTAALKILVCALEYRSVAEAKGGYPNGYISVARNLEIVGNSFHAKELSWQNAIAIIYNALYSPVALKKFGEDGRIGVITGDQSFVSKHYNLERRTGILTDTENTLRLKNSSTSKIGIDSNLYETEVTDKLAINKLLGCSVIYFYNTETDRVVAVVEDTKWNNWLTIEPDDISYVSGTKAIAYWNENNKEVTAKLSNTAKIYYNGKIAYDITTADFMPKNGNIVLIDNDNNREYDYVLITNSEYMVIGRSSMEKLVSMYDINKVIEIDDDMVFYKNGFEIEPDAISEWDVLKVMKSKDGKVNSIDVITRTLKGTVERVYNKDGDQFVQVNGAEYKLGEIFVNAYKNHNYRAVEPKKGQLFTFILNETNTILGTKVISTNEFEYGFLVAVADGEGLNTNPRFKIFTNLGKMTIYDKAENLKIDGIRLGEDGAKQFFVEGNKFKPQLIMYKLTEDNKLKEIKTAVDAQKSSGGAGYDLENFSLDVTSSKAEEDDWAYNSAYQTVKGHRINANGITPLFFIPADKSDDDKYAFYNADQNMGLFNRSKCYFELYDLKKYTEAYDFFSFDAMVVYEMPGDQSSQNPYSIDSFGGSGQPTDFFIVNETMEEIGYNDEVMTKIVATNMTDKSEFVAYCSEDAYNVDTSSVYGFGSKKLEDLSSGDIIQVAYANPYSSSPVVDRFLVYAGSEWYADRSVLCWKDYEKYDYIDITTTSTGVVYGEVVYIDETTYIFYTKDKKGEDLYIGAQSATTPACKIYSY